MACGTHLFNTDPVRLHFPLAGEMFDPVVPNIYMRPGYLSLDIFCPICGAFPFWPDGRKSGFRGVGRNLKTLGADNKPKIMPVEDILSLPVPWVQLQEIAPTPSKSEIDKAVKELLDESVKEFPCPECGAKRRIHKKGCSKLPANQAKVEPEEIITVPDGVQPENVPSWIVSQVEKSDGVPPDAPPTEQELAELAREREHRAMIEKTSDTRPMEGV